MARKHISIRISGNSDADLRDLAEQYGVPYTFVVRACLATAFNHLDEVKRTLATAGRTQ